MTGEQLTLDNIILKEGTILCVEEKMNQTKSGIIVPDSANSMAGLCRVVKENCSNHNMDSENVYGYKLIKEGDYVALVTSVYSSYQIGDTWYLIVQFDDIAYIARV